MADGTIKILTDLSVEGFKKGVESLPGIAKGALSTVTKSIAAVSAALTAAGGFAVGVGSSFEAAMSQVAAISGAAGDDLERLTEKAKEMGSTSKFSATESAQALTFMSMAGWDAQQMLDGLSGVMDLAAASGEDLATVSDIVTDAMTAFGLSADQAGHFSDVIATASSNANTNVSMLGESFKYVAPVAGALGYSVEDISVALGLMANSGIKGSQAGTSLRSMLSRLSKPTKEVRDAMDALGVSLTDSNGEMLSFDEIARNMRVSFGDLTEAEKAEYAATIAGQEAMSGLLAIVSASDEDFEKLTTAIGNADGASAKMAETMQDNLQGSITIAKSALEGLGITIYGEIESPLKSAVEKGTGYINRLNGAFSKGLNSGIAELGSVVGDALVDIANAAPKMVEAATGAIKSFLSGLKSNKGKIAKAVAEIAKSLVDSFKSIIPELITAAAEIGGALADELFGKGVGDAIRGLGDTINKVFGKATEAVGGVIKVVGDLITILGPPLLGAFQLVGEVVGFVLDIINTVLGFVGDITGGLADLARGRDIVDGYSDTLNDMRQAAADAAEEMNALRESTDKNAGATNAEYDRVKDLVAELDGLVDANGNVKKGYEERAAFIVGELSEATGEEIEIIDGQIKKYDELKARIGEIIEQKRTEALLAVYQEQYKEALAQQTEAYDRLKTAEEAMIERQALMEAARREYHKADAELTRKQLSGYYNAHMDEVAIDQERLAYLERFFRNQETLVNEATADWQVYADQYGQIQSDIQQYEDATGAALAGNFEKAQTILQDQSYEHSKYADTVEDDSKQVSENVRNSASEVERSADKIKKALDKSVDGFSKKAKTETSVAVSDMARQMGNASIPAPKVQQFTGAESNMMRWLSAAQIYANAHPVYVSTQTTGGYGRNAKGGVTGYAKGGWSQGIEKHAAGVFTSRTRLWDPVTGINEYGEAGHEALLPLKASVFDEIANGIVRQLSTTKLASIMDKARTTVSAETARISGEITLKSDFRTDTGNLTTDRMDALERKFDAVISGLDKLANLTVAIDRETVGRLVADPVNASIGEIYDLDERGRF